MMRKPGQILALRRRALRGDKVSRLAASRLVEELETVKESYERKAKDLVQANKEILHSDRELTSEFKSINAAHTALEDLVEWLRGSTG